MSVRKTRVYDNVDYDYPMCGGDTIDQIDGKPIYVVTHESNMSGQRSGGTRQVTLSRIADMDEVVYETSLGEQCTVADCIICNEIGAYGRDHLSDINLSIVEDIQTRKGHVIV